MEYKDYIVKYDEKINECLIKLNNNLNNFLICLDKSGKVLGTITWGDFRNFVSKKKLNLNDNIGLITNQKYIFLKKKYKKKQLEILFQKNDITFIPIIENGKLINIIRKSDIYNTSTNKLEKLQLVIMAGGEGTRLKPFTNFIPKPLMPIGDKPIINIIIDSFKKFGCNKIIVSINNKAKLLESYLKTNYKNLRLIKEDDKLGTVGSLFLLKKILKKTFFLSNCDILIKTDLEDLYNFHLKNKFDITLVGVYRNIKIDYGVCEINKKNELIEIKEKPSFKTIINSGVYLIEPTILKLLKKKEYLDMNELIKRAKKNNYKVGVYNIIEEGWTDIGQISNYFNFLEKKL